MKGWIFLAILAVLAVTTVNSFDPLDDFRLIKTFCEIQRKKSPGLYKRYRLETHCLVAVSVFNDDVRHFKLSFLYS